MDNLESELVDAEDADLIEVLDAVEAVPDDCIEVKKL